ncbi:MAG: hypothetical protein JW836_15975, partial [Deltaproteobacteria bacterium]|nr:hypothetical protein [Deltaproteobacteria bacterium]
MGLARDRTSDIANMGIMRIPVGKIRSLRFGCQLHTGAIPSLATWRPFSNRSSISARGHVLIRGSLSRLLSQPDMPEEVLVPAVGRATGSPLADSAELL